MTERRNNFKNLQDLELVREELYKKVQLLQSRQDLYLESARLNEVDNKKKLDESTLQKRNSECNHFTYWTANNNFR